MININNAISYKLNIEKVMGVGMRFSFLLFLKRPPSTLLRLLILLNAERNIKS